MKRFLVITLLLWTAIATMAPASADPQQELSAFKEVQQSKWEAQKELQQKDVEALRQQIAAVDKRVDDQFAQLGQSVDRFGTQITVLGVVITVLLVLGGFLGYRNAKSEAKDAAAVQAKSSAEAWFENRAGQLEKRISELEDDLAQKATQAHGRMEQHEKKVQQRAIVFEQATQVLQDRLEKASTAQNIQMAFVPTKSLPTQKQQEAQQLLDSRAQELQQTPEDSYSFDDWNIRAHAAYAASKLEEATYFWHKAASASDASAVRAAQALMNRGIALDQLNQSEAALATFDDLLGRFSDSTEPTIRELVAKSLFNKGTTLGRLDQNKAALAIFDELLRRFFDATEPRIREGVARTLFNKGITQTKLNQSEAALATFDELLHRLGDSKEPALCELIFMTKNSSGFVRLLQGKALGPRTPSGQQKLQTALDTLNDAEKHRETSDGMLLGNRAYVQCLLGKTMQAKTDFATALRAPVFGGQELYEATLKDLERHPVEEDAEMRTLVEKAWADYQAEQNMKDTSVSPDQSAI